MCSSLSWHDWGGLGRQLELKASASPKSSSQAKLEWPREMASELARDRLGSDAEGWCSPPRLTRPFTKSSSDSRSDRSSKEGRPWGRDARSSSKGVLDDVRMAEAEVAAKLSPFSSSSLAPSVGSPENSGASVELTEPTVRFRGSQKSRSSETVDRA